MPDEFATSTRRGLVWTAYTEAILVGGLLLFVLFPQHAGFLLFGVGGSLLLGIPAGWKLWGGRREFGPAHEQSIRRGALVFTLLATSLVFAFFQVTVTVPDPERLKITDLRAPWFFLGLAILLDAGGIWFLLAQLVDARARRWLYLVLSLGMVSAVVYAWLGWRHVSDYIERSGGVAVVPQEAQSYANDFTMDVGRLFAVATLVMRIGFWPSLANAFRQVADAEQAAKERHLSATFAPDPA